MKKKIVQDVVPPKKSIRNLELNSRARDFGANPSKDLNKDIIKPQTDPIPKKDPFTRPVSIRQESPIKIEPVNLGNPPFTPNTQSYKYGFDEPKNKSKKSLYIAGLIFILVSAFGISSFFRSAEIKITPQEKTKTLNETFSAKKDALPNNLGFQVVSISRDLEKNVDPKDTSGEQKVERKAQGRIIIYNNYNSEVQKLVATTRFETPEGLIYRLVSPAAVPGRTTKDGKIVPGSIEVLVEADKTGPSYNIGLKDFTIPGFKSDSNKFKNIYARSKTEMTGGFSGVQRVVSKDFLNKSETEMDESLRTSLYNDLVNQIPAEFILYPSSLSYKFEPISQISSATGGVVLKKKGTTSAIIFDKSSLTRAIQSKILPEANSSVVRISNLDNLIFSNQASSTPVTNSTSSVTFSLKGEPNFVWVVDENKLKTDLLGLSKKNARVVVASNPSIKETWILTRPFWNQNIPTDPNKVDLVNTLSQ